MSALPARHRAVPMVHREIEGFEAIVREAGRMRWHIGCAAIGVEGLCHWFDPEEMQALRRKGYHVADASKCEVLGRGAWQCLVRSRRPMKHLPKVRWSEVMGRA